MAVRDQVLNTLLEKKKRRMHFSKFFGGKITPF